MKHAKKNKALDTLELIGWICFALGALALINILGTWFIATY